MKTQRFRSDTSGYQTGVVPWASFGPSPDNLVFDVTHPD